MQVVINPGNISGIIIPPASKSMMQRVCAAALLQHGTTIIRNPGISKDDHAALNIIQQLGAVTEHKLSDELHIRSKGISPIHDTIDCGESGLSARLFTPIAALAHEKITITGHGSLLQRPMNELGSILQQAGVMLADFKGYLPVQLKGPVIPQDISIDGSVSSQYLTGILFALAFTADKPVTISVKDLKSRPYIDLSLQVLADYGIIVTHNNYTSFYISPVQNRRTQDTITQTIESDWSSAAAWIVAGASQAGSVIINNMNQTSAQADKEILKAVELAGASVSWQGNALHIRSNGHLQAFTFDATHCPDLFPVLSVLAAGSKGTSIIKGLHRLIHKESDRRESTSHMLQQLDVTHTTQDDLLIIEGKDILQASTIDAHNDHRIVMAGAIAAVRANGPIVIKGAEAVSKSYPAFFNDLQQAGITVQTFNA